MSNATGGVMQQQMADNSKRKSAYDTPRSADHAGTPSGGGGPGGTHGSHSKALSGSTDKPSLLDDSSHAGKLPLSPGGRGGSGVGSAQFSRNVPERSTFHAGMARSTHKGSAGRHGAFPTVTQDTSAINPANRPSNFFSKLSSKFSKRQFESNISSGQPSPVPQLVQKNVGHGVGNDSVSSGTIGDSGVPTHHAAGGGGMARADGG